MFTPIMENGQGTQTEHKMDAGLILLTRYWKASLPKSVGLYSVLPRMRCIENTCRNSEEGTAQGAEVGSSEICMNGL